MKLGYIGIDQYNNHYHISKYPRKELLEQLGMKHAEKMYHDTVNGKARHSGYIISGMWIDVYEVHSWDSKGKN